MAGLRDDEEVRGFFEELPEDVRAGFRVAAFGALADVAEEQGVPVEELVTPERVEELAVTFFRKHGGGDQVGNPIANMTEFFTEQERRRIYPEDELRLSE